ncbi:MAG: cell division protein SepF [Cyanobacteriota bacterium]
MKSFLDSLKKLIGLNEEMTDEQEDTELLQQQVVTPPMPEVIQQPLVQQPVAQQQVIHQPHFQQQTQNVPNVYAQAPLQQNMNLSPDFEDILLEEQNKRKRVAKQNGNIIDISTPPSNEMVIIEPKNLDDASRVVSLLRSKKAVIVSYMNSTLSPELKDAISNFICGAISALDGNQEIITQQGVFLFTPGNININNLGDQPSLQKTVDKSANNLFFTINDISNSKKKEKDSKVS